MSLFWTFLFCFSFSLVSYSQELQTKGVEKEIPVSVISIEELCKKQWKSLPGVFEETSVNLICAKMNSRQSCQSVEGIPIYHYEKLSGHKKGKKILVIGLIHGDELPAGTMVHLWMKRLEEIDPVSSWRILPISNPDGLAKKSRLNAKGIDLNRNFPTQDWDQLAKKFWEEKTNRNPRRFPGEMAGSEPETKCIQSHIEDYKPDFVISIHTPYAVLDFDGPNIVFPKFLQLPWQRLGNYPGSLGRFMWVDRKIPVLTIEMKGQLPADPEYLLNLQDISSQVARLSAGAALISKPKQAFNQ